GAESVREEYNATSFSRNPLKKILLRIYLNYTVQQETFSPHFQSLRRKVAAVFGEKIPSWFAAEYRRLNLPLMKYYAVLTTNTRMIVLTIWVLTDHVWLYFAVEIVAINFLMVVVTRYQEQLSAGLLGQIEERVGTVEAGRDR